MKKFLIYFAISFFIATSAVMSYIYTPENYDAFDNKIRDMLFDYRGPIATTGNVAILDIDEKSLKELGQWPWGRDVVSQILVNLTNNGVGAIGFDIVFSEEDGKSPHKIFDKMGVTPLIPQDKYINYDEVMASVVSQTPTIMGYVFDFDTQEHLGKEAPQIPAVFVQKGKGEMEYLLEPKGVIKNTPLIQENSYSSGFFNNTPDGDSIIRNVPLAISYDMSVYPSLALELVRALMAVQKVEINYSDGIGINSVVLGEKVIPTDRNGRIFVNFRGPGHTFKYISASDVYNNTVDKKEIEGKIILVGTSAAGLLDLRAIPFDPVYPGVEVHANVIDNILAGDFLRKPAEADAINLLMIVFLSFVITFIIGYSSAIFLPFIIVVVGAFILYAGYYTLFEMGVIYNIFFPLAVLLTSAISATIASYFLETRAKNLIKGKFASKVSPQVMADILKNAEGGGEMFIANEREIAVTFSDVRNFTNISEAAGNAQTLIQFLNEYMDDMTQIIMRSGGTVDKFIGDAIMSYWNAPADVPNFVEKSVDATLDQIHAVKPLNVRIKADSRFANIVKMSDSMGVDPVEIGIGINVGVATVGEMGSSGRSDYTVIGDPINLGARLESLCKSYNSKCNISNHVKDRIPQDKYIFRLLDLATVKGQSKPIEIWQIHDYRVLPKEWEKDGYLFKVSLEEIDKEIELYHKAVKLYQESHFAEALVILKDMDTWPNKTNKYIYKTYIERCEHYIEEPPVDFNGVFVHKTKG